MSTAQIRESIANYQIPRSESPILVVDDEPSICHLLEQALEDYPVTIANNAMEAYTAMAETAFRLVICDKNLPGGESGIDVIRRGRQLLHPRTEFLMITGYGNLDSAQEAIDLGVFAYLSKPFEIPTLLEHVGRALDRNQTFFRNELLIERLSQAHSELFQKKMDVLLADEIAESNLVTRNEELSESLAVLCETLEAIAAGHAAISEYVAELASGTERGKSIIPDLKRALHEQRIRIAGACKD